MENSELITKLRDAEANTELDCEIHELRPVLIDATSALEAADKRIAELEAMNISHIEYFAIIN